MNINFIGIGGKISHGKSEIAKVLVGFGWCEVLFSDALKEEVLVRLNRTLREVVRTSIFDDYTHVPTDLRWTRERGHNEAWWDRRLRWELWVRKQPAVRALLQEYGTEVRRADDPDYWVKAWTRRACSLGKRVVAADVRFPNEAEAIRNLRGVLVRVVRPRYLDFMVDGVDTHTSETSLDDKAWWDFEIVNDGSLDDLRNRAMDLFRYQL